MTQNKESFEAIIDNDIVQLKPNLMLGDVHALSGQTNMNSSGRISAQDDSKKESYSRHLNSALT